MATVPSVTDPWVHNNPNEKSGRLITSTRLHVQLCIAIDQCGFYSFGISMLTTRLTILRIIGVTESTNI